MLLQAYISHLKLEGFALMSDMVYVTQVRNKRLTELVQNKLLKVFFFLEYSQLSL